MKHPMQCEKCFRVCRLSDSGKTWVCTICKHREKANGRQAVSRYKYTKLKNLGPVHGFIIRTPDDRELRDTNPQAIVRELNRLNDRIKHLIELGLETSEYGPQTHRELWEKEAKL